MPDLHQIVNFRPLADDRRAYGGAVYCGPCAYFHIVLDNYRPRLTYLKPGIVRPLRVSKSVAADHNVVLQDHPVAESASFADDAMRVDHDACAYPGALIDHAMRQYRSVVSDDHVGADH